MSRRRRESEPSLRLRSRRRREGSRSDERRLEESVSKRKEGFRREVLRGGSESRDEMNVGPGDDEPLR